MRTQQTMPPCVHSRACRRAYTAEHTPRRVHSRACTPCIHSRTCPRAYTAEHALLCVQMPPVRTQLSMLLCVHSRPYPPKGTQQSMPPCIHSIAYPHVSTKEHAPRAYTAEDTTEPQWLLRHSVKPLTNSSIATDRGCYYCMFGESSTLRVLIVSYVTHLQCQTVVNILIMTPRV